MLKKLAPWFIILAITVIGIHNSIQSRAILNQVNQSHQRELTQLTRQMGQLTGELSQSNAALEKIRKDLDRAQAAEKENRKKLDEYMKKVMEKPLEDRIVEMQRIGETVEIRQVGMGIVFTPDAFDKILAKLLDGENAIQVREPNYKLQIAGLQSQVAEYIKREDIWGKKEENYKYQVDSYQKNNAYLRKYINKQASDKFWKQVGVAVVAGTVGFILAAQTNGK